MDRWQHGRQPHQVALPLRQTHVILPDGHKTISPGVVRKAEKALDECHN